MQCWMAGCVLPVELRYGTEKVQVGGTQFNAPTQGRPSSSLPPMSSPRRRNNTRPQLRV